MISTDNAGATGNPKTYTIFTWGNPYENTSRAGGGFITSAFQKCYLALAIGGSFTQFSATRPGSFQAHYDPDAVVYPGDDPGHTGAYVYDGYSAAGTGSDSTYILDTGDPSTFPSAFQLPFGVDKVPVGVTFAENVWYGIGYSIDTSSGAAAKVFGNGPTGSPPQPLVTAHVSANLVVNGVASTIAESDITYPATGSVNQDTDMGTIVQPFSGSNFTISDALGNVLFNPPSIPALNQRVQFGPIMIWTNRYIDWTNPDNYAAAVQSSGGRRTPQPVSVAVARFGSPSILCAGNVDTYSNNQGTGGSLSKVGTINDVSGPAF
jgi:hypothetical protein